MGTSLEVEGEAGGGTVWRKTTVWTLLALATIVAISLVVVALRIYFANARLNLELARIRSAGDPVCLADLAQAPLPDDRNAAIVLEGIQQDLQAFSLQVDEYWKSENRTAGCPTDSQLKTIEEAFAAYPAILPAVRDAASMDGCDWQLDYAQTPQLLIANLGGKVAVHRKAVQVLILHATVLRAHDQWDEAVRVSVPVLRLAQQLDRNGPLVVFLSSLFVRSEAIDIANHALHAGPVSVETHRLLEKELAAIDLMPGYVNALKGERAFGIECFNRGIFPGRIRHFQRTPELLNYLSLMNTTIQPSSASLDPWLLRDMPNCTYAASVQPALEATRDAVEKCRARLRALRVLNALVARQDPDSPPPADLAELGLPRIAMTDPFSGKPLMVEQLPTGWLVYSVGANRTDEGGKLDGFSDVGVGPVEPVADVE